MLLLELRKEDIQQVINRDECVKNDSSPHLALIPDAELWASRANCAVSWCRFSLICHGWHI